MDIDSDEDKTAAAYASITESLNQITSSRVGTFSWKQHDDVYQADALDWMNDEDDYSPADEEMQEAYTTPAKRAAVVERADTPVMSNSSKKKKKPEDEDEVPDPIQSPWVRQLVPTSRATPNPNPSHEYRRYHDSLLVYLKARRNMAKRVQLEQDETKLLMEGVVEEGATVELGSTTDIPSRLAQEEARLDMDFLRALNALCWDRGGDSSVLEGNFWMLLLTLRSLGLDALLWEDDAASDQQNRLAIPGFLQNLAASNTHNAPLQVLEEVAARPASPLVLQRRKQLLKWLEACADRERPKITITSGASSSNDSHPDEPFLVNEHAVGGNDEDLHVCLQYILAGRLEDAQDFMRKRGQQWRAASWGGGHAAGTKSVPDERSQSMKLVSVGNPNRALWKRQMWRLSNQTKGVEAAIHAILANNHTKAISNPFLRSWESGLYAILSSMWGRIEEDALRMHNEYRRQSRPPYPGTQHETQEKEQLQATTEAAALNETGAVHLLQASPFEEMRGFDTMHQAMASFVIGKASLVDYLVAESDDLENCSVSHLRFLTHVVLYLDSLTYSTCPVRLTGISLVRDKIVFKYVQHLASREDLWHMLALYASFLPEGRLVEYYPRVLQKVDGIEERRAMVAQMKDLFFSADLVLHILRQTVRHILAEPDSESSDVTREDIRKMKAIHLLCFHDEHMFDALICANMLLRHFLRANKAKSAIKFDGEFLPVELEETIQQGQAGDAEQSNTSLASKKESARAEYRAIRDFLDGYRALEEWKDCLDKTSASTEVEETVNPDSLAQADASIAKSMARRDIVRKKRKDSRAVVEVALAAYKKFMTVLTHPGGWLLLEDEVAVDDEERKRHHDIEEIRTQYLPLTVSLVHFVCKKTAMWMSRSLDDIVPLLADRPAAAVRLLDDGADVLVSPLSPKYWLKNALDLAETVATDEYNIHAAYAVDELEEFLTTMAETAVADLMEAM